MNDRKDQPSLAKYFRIGTPECAIFCGAAAMALGLLLLTVGFWNTVWIALFGVIGGRLGGVKDKKQKGDHDRSEFSRPSGQCSNRDAEQSSADTSG